MEHTYLTEENCCCHDPEKSGKDADLTCPVCIGGLAVCSVCQLYEGSLTTHCSRVKAFRNADRIYRGDLDYRDGFWIDGLCSIYSPMFLSQQKTKEFSFSEWLER